MLDAPVAAIFLQSSGVDALVGEREAGAVPELVRMDQPFEAGSLSDRC